MDPISNQIFSHDFQKFVLQDPDYRFIHNAETVKPFDIKAPDKSEKSKKDVKKEKKEGKREEKDQNSKDSH